MLLAVDLWSLVGGVFFVGSAAWTAINRHGAAEGIQRYYDSIPEGRWGPKWLRWQFRPTPRQADIIAWLTIPFCGAIGMMLLATAIT